MMKFRHLLLFGILILAGSCTNTIEDYNPDDPGTAYFPLQTGHSWTYQLDSVVYDNNGLKVDSISTIIREKITDTFTGESSGTIFRVERSILKNNQWVITDIWTASMDDRLAYRTEENLRFAKLSFPVQEGVTWNGNAFFDPDIITKIAGEPLRIYQNWGDYNYTSVDSPETIGNHNYDRICTVVQADLEDRISRRFSAEKYAYGTGLVHRKMIILNTQKFESNEPWSEKAEEGFILEQTLLSFEPGG
jgi:hypothetical protein